MQLAVALKVLPPQSSFDLERLARLEREARMLAALNHPDIASIYGLDFGLAKAPHPMPAASDPLTETLAFRMRGPGSTVSIRACPPGESGLWRRDGVEPLIIRFSESPSRIIQRLHLFGIKLV